MKAILTIVALTLSPTLACTPVHAQQMSSPSEQVERGQVTSPGGAAVFYRVRLLPPDSFPDVPSTVRDVLRAKGCMIPQTWQAHTPENVIHGAFSGRGASDWAVLCSRNRISSLLVFFAGKPQTPTELAASSNDQLCVHHPGTTELGYGWAIDVAAPKRILSFKTNKGNYQHDGVEDSIIGRGSKIHFFGPQEWVAMRGDEP